MQIILIPMIQNGLRDIMSLKNMLHHHEFKERKDYLLDKKRFEKTEMFKEVQEYDKLKKNEDIIWYFKVKDSNKFDILKQQGTDIQ